MIIKIISDETYGYFNNGFVEAKTKDSEPFQVDNTKGKRLISLGTAEEIKKAKEEPKEEPTEEAVKAEKNTPEHHLDGGQLSEMSINELRALAKDMGIAASGSKKDLIARLEAESVEIDNEADIQEESESEEAEEVTAEADEADEEPPVLEAADPEV